MRAWCRPALVVIDNVGLGQLKRRGAEPTAAHMLFTMLDRRNMAASTALTSNLQLPRRQFGATPRTQREPAQHQLIAFIAEPTVAKRILDHLRLDSTGPPLAPPRGGEPDSVEPAPPTMWRTPCTKGEPDRPRLAPARPRLVDPAPSGGARGSPSVPGLRFTLPDCTSPGYGITRYRTLICRLEVLPTHTPPPPKCAALAGKRPI